ncbi:hypothetical protein ACFQZT_21925 [Paenibacillus sp. GCM10027628]|uniref:hypothetical protein n=1 Tax=Paenibacillus sp. GCM10027628 TaxID=3273413 RepID=UPI00362B0944
MDNSNRVLLKRLKHESRRKSPSWKIIGNRRVQRRIGHKVAISVLLGRYFIGEMFQTGLERTKVYTERTIRLVKKLGMASARFNSVTMKNIAMGSIPFSLTSSNDEIHRYCFALAHPTAFFYSLTMENIAIHAFPFTFTSVTLNNIVPASISVT